MKRILYIQYTNPAAYPPLEHGSRILAKEGWEAFFLGTGDSVGGTLRFPPHPNIIEKRLPFCPAGWRQKFHYLRFCFWTVWRTFRWRPKWLYVSDPMACPAGLLSGMIPGIRVIYHEHDWPPRNEAPSFFFQLILSARRRMARRAQWCVVPNEERARRFQLETGIGEKVWCVWNCPAREEISPPRAPHQKPNLWLIYHGSLVPSRLPITLFEALRMLPGRVKLRVIGYETVGYRGYLQQLKDKAGRLGIRSQVEFLGTLPTRRDLLEYCRRSDVGLAFTPRDSSDLNNHTMTGASNKPFDYLACGAALLVTDLPDWGKVFVEPGFGLACDADDPKSIAQALQWFLKHPGQMRAMGERGRQRILTDWNYEKQFSSVLEQLEVA